MKNKMVNTALGPNITIDDQAKIEAESLCMSIYNQHYRAISPDFELCDSTAGVISQINNMVAGLPDENKRLKEQLAHVCERTRNLIQPAFFCLQIDKTPEHADRNKGAIADIDRLLAILMEAEAVVYCKKS